MRSSGGRVRQSSQLAAANSAYHRAHVLDRPIDRDRLGISQMPNALAPVVSSAIQHVRREILMATYSDYQILMTTYSDLNGSAFFNASN
jgi:hypothetical protein